MIDEGIIEKLTQSREIIGEVNPIILDWDGEVLSGSHRKEAGWERKYKVDTRELAEKWDVTPLMAKDMIRLHLNIQRKPSKEETQFLLRRMALSLKDKGIPAEMVATELAKRVPYSHQYVLQLLPDKYKQQEKAVKLGKPNSVKLVSHGSHSEDTRQELGEGLNHAVRCSCCSLSTFYPQEYEGKQVCRRCFKKLQEGIKEMPAPQVQKPTKIAATLTQKSCAQNFQEQMHPRISNMHQAIIERLQKEGFRFETEKEYCIQSTTPDIDLLDHDLFIYLDGEEVHKNRTDKDKQRRELLAKRYHKRVLSLTYSDDTKEQENQVFKQIKEAIA